MKKIKILSIAIIMIMFVFNYASIVADDESTQDIPIADETTIEKVDVEAGSADLDIIIIDNTGYKKDKKAPYKFTHLAHAKDYGISCWECHHVYDETAKELQNKYKPWIETQRCITCHDPVKKTNQKIRHLEKAFHDNCKDCHKKLSKEKQKTALTKCTECHPKVTK